MRYDKYATYLDKIGMQEAAKKIIEERLDLLPRPPAIGGKITSFETIDDLLKRDKRRQEDGFARKIKFRRILVGSRGVISIPHVEEESLSHGDFEPKRIVELNQNQDDDDDITQSPGSGKGKVGDVIGEVPLPLGGGDGGGDDEGENGDSEGGGGGDTEGGHFEEGAYELGKQLTEKLELPNLTEKKKRFPTDEYTFELTDRHRSTGQLLDKKETLKRMVKTNLILGRVNKEDMDPTKMIISSRDKTYRVLSRERIWKSQAVVFFLRDMSPSMWGGLTEALLSQHLMIYAWLLAQYEKRVVPRFFVHGTSAKEVSPRQYFSPNTTGSGTIISSGYKAINKTVENEGLADDYDIFIFQGTDGEDWDSKGTKAVPEIEKILGYVSRMGVTLFSHRFYESQNLKTAFEQYVEGAGFLEREDVFRMHKMPGTNVTDEKNLEALKALIAQD